MSQEKVALSSTGHTLMRIAFWAYYCNSYITYTSAIAAIPEAIDLGSGTMAY